MARWEVLRGIHVDKSATLVSIAPENKDDRSRPDTFYAGDTIETDKDLSRHNRGGVARFKKLDDSENDELQSMTVPQLLELAAAENIELPGKKLARPQLLAAIRGALAYRTAIA